MTEKLNVLCKVDTKMDAMAIKGNKYFSFSFIYKLFAKRFLPKVIDIIFLAPVKRYVNLTFKYFVIYSLIFTKYLETINESIALFNYFKPHLLTRLEKEEI